MEEFFTTMPRLTPWYMRVILLFYRAHHVAEYVVDDDGVAHVYTCTYKNRKGITYVTKLEET